jgi:hypothetical protein
VSDYQKFLDDLLLAIAAVQTEQPGEAVDITALCRTQFPDAHSEWVETAARQLASQGYGKDFSTKTNQYFLVEGRGWLRVEEIRNSRKPKRILDHIKDISRRYWIAIGALLVALIALFK